MNKNNKIYLALLIPLVLWPLLWATRSIPYIPMDWLNTPRPGWWSFIITVMVLEWSVFFYLRNRLHKIGESWDSIGLDFSWFVRNKKWLIPYVTVLLVMALFAPNFLYDNELPSQGQVIPITPVSSAQRVFFILVSMTAGICEEVMFRGVGITFLRRVFNNKWIPVLITSLCFVFIHGPFRGWPWFSQYFIIGALFAIGYVAQKKPRLEVLIIIHFTVDASLAAFVP